MTPLPALFLALAQAPPVFRAGVEAVYVDAFVTVRDAPVSGLTASDFVVTDNGVAQEVRILDMETVHTTAVLAFDTSASMAGEKLEHLRGAARAFVAGLRARDEAALVGFDHEIVLSQPPTTDREALRRALAGLSAGGATSLIDALYLCLAKRWGTGRPLLVLFTDGEDTRSWLENEDLLKAARESSTLVHIVATHEPEPLAPLSFGGRVPQRPQEPGYLYLLRQVAETTGGALRVSESSARLEAAFLKILEAVNARYVLSYEPTGVQAAGRHRLKVSVKRPGAQVRARQEYSVAPGPGR